MRQGSRRPVRRGQPVLLRERVPSGEQLPVQHRAAPHDVDEPLPVALVPGRSGAVGSRDDGGVELAQQPPLGVHGWDGRLRADAAGVPRGEHLPHGTGGRRDTTGHQSPRRRRLLALLRRLQPTDAGEAQGVLLDLGVVLLAPEGPYLPELRAEVAVKMVRPGEHVLQRPQPQLGRAVLHRQGVLELDRHRQPQQLTAAAVGGVDEGHHHAVARVVVGLPVDRVVLVGPRHVPHGHAGQRHRGDARILRAQAELRVVPLDEYREREPHRAHDRGGDEAHPPAVVVDVDAAVHPLGLAQRVLGEVVRLLGVRDRAPHEAVPVHLLAERVQHRRQEHVEHVPADDGVLAHEVL